MKILPFLDAVSGETKSHRVCPHKRCAERSFPRLQGLPSESDETFSLIFRDRIEPLRLGGGRQTPPTERTPPRHRDIHHGTEQQADCDGEQASLHVRMGSPRGAAAVFRTHPAPGVKAMEKKGGAAEEAVSSVDGFVYQV